MGPDREPERPPIVYPAPPDPPRIQYLASIASTGALPRRQTTFQDFVLGVDSNTGQMLKPYGIALHGGRLFVCDTVLNNVISYRFDSGAVRLLSTNLGADRLLNPINIAIAPDGTKYIADIDRGQVVVFGPDDSYQTSLGLPGSAQPCDVAIDGDRLFVADIQDDEIEIWDRRTGEALGAFGGPGNEPGQFHGPTNIALAPDGTLWVTDTNGFRIQHLTAEGEALLVHGRVGMGHGEFARPKGIAVDSAGRAHVVDAAFNNVQVFNDRGDLLMFYGGSGPDRSHLDLPADVEIVTDPDAVALFADRVMPGERVSHLLLVSSQFGEPRVNVYGFLDEGMDAPIGAVVPP
jgi:hypothetical protein